MIQFLIPDHPGAPELPVPKHGTGKMLIFVYIIISSEHNDYKGDITFS